MRQVHRAGEVIDGWVLEEFLGAGGNGEVWRAHRGPEAAALKILWAKDPGRDAYRRFRAEVEFMRGHPHDGVLPLIGASVPERLAKGEYAWLATPEAELSSSALTNVPLAEVVRAGLAFAATLADLAAEDVSHRDIKPDNLFRHQDGWKVGDWGLVSYPNKEALTEDGRKLGPTWFLAPEMLSNPQHADGRPADVYSLAKSLWVLAAGQNFPPTGGTLRRDEPAFRLSSVVTDDRADHLERLLEDATAHRVEDRPTMPQVVEELSAWLGLRALFSDSLPRTIPDLSDLGRRVDAKTAPSQIALKRRLDQTEEARNYFAPWYGVLERQIMPLVQTVVPGAAIGGVTANELFVLKDVADLGGAVADTSATSVIAHSGPIGPTHVMLRSVLGQTLVADRPFVRLAAGHIVQYGRPRNVIWSDYRDAPLASAKHHQGLIDLVDGLRDSLRSALEVFAEKIEELLA